MENDNECSGRAVAGGCDWDHAGATDWRVLGERMNSIKSCPFCGGDARYFYQSSNLESWVRTGCKDCGNGTKWNFHEEDASRAWDRRECDRPQEVNLQIAAGELLVAWDKASWEMCDELSYSELLESGAIEKLREALDTYKPR